MKLNIEINNMSESPVGDDFLKSVAEETFAKSGCDFPGGMKASVSIALVTPEEIKKINKEYRKNDCATDVLSFPEFESIQELREASQKNAKGELFLGELILCYDDIKDYSLSEGLELKKELARVISHGILHLVGFSHGKEMFEVQEEIVGGK